MHDAVSRLCKIVVAITAGIAVSALISVIALTVGLHYYDSATKKALLRVVAQQLPPHSSMSDMQEFMRRRTTRYAFNDLHGHDYSGFLPQTSLDRFLFDRGVQIVLYVDTDQTFSSADVRVYYTWL